MIKTTALGSKYSLDPVKVIALYCSDFRFHRPEGHVGISNLWLDLALFSIVEIIQSGHLGVVDPLLGLIDSGLWRIDLDLFAEICDILTLLENFNEMDHSGLT